MSDIAEMAKEMGRAIRLADWSAASRIKDELLREIDSLSGDDAHELERYAEPLLNASAGGNTAESLALCLALAAHAVRIDARRNDFYGAGFEVGMDIAKRADNAAPIWN